MGKSVEFTSNGKSATGWMEPPESGRGPGVVVIQEWWGLDPHIKDIVGRFARERFAALALDLYHGEETTEPDEGEELMMAMDLERVASDMKGAVEYLAAHAAVTGPGVGAVAFCIGVAWSHGWHASRIR